MSLIAAVGATLKRSVTLSAPWSDLAATSIAPVKNNEDRTITFGGSARTATASYAGSGTLKYRLDSGSWTSYSGGFSISSGQTLAWQITMSANQTDTPCTTSIGGYALPAFNIRATGF